MSCSRISRRSDPQYQWFSKWLAGDSHCVSAIRSGQSHRGMAITGNATQSIARNIWKNDNSKRVCRGGGAVAGDAVADVHWNNRTASHKNGLMTSRAARQTILAVGA